MPYLGLSVGVRVLTSRRAALIAFRAVSVLPRRHGGPPRGCSESLGCQLGSGAFSREMVSVDIRGYGGCGSAGVGRADGVGKAEAGEGLEWGQGRRGGSG